SARRELVEAVAGGARSSRAHDRYGAGERSLSMEFMYLPVFAETAARASVVLAATGLVAAALRRSSASARHLVWVLGLTSALLVPALSVAVPKLEVPIVRIASDARSVAPATAPSFAENRIVG